MRDKGVYWWVPFVLILVASALGTILGQIYRYNQNLEGKAKSAMIMQLQGIEIPPEQARFAQIVITTTDVQISMAQAKITVFE